MTTAAAPARTDWEERPGALAAPAALPVAVALALGMHLLLLVVSFEMPTPDPAQRTTRPLEVMVLRHPAATDERPEEADALAQVDRIGGGEEGAPEATEPTAVEAPAQEAQEMPLEPAPTEPPPEPSPPTPDLLQPAAPPESPPTLTARIEEDLPAEEPLLAEPEPAPALELPKPQVTAAEILASRSLEIAELTARLDETTSGHARRPRRKAISASTREYKYANYLESWRRKVERIGNLNYPDEAKQRSLYGSLILHVAVKADGSLEAVRVLRSSGFDVLDNAAIRIVELAAPFAPFPPDIKDDTDVLDITRTWQFLSSNRLGWEN